MKVITITLPFLNIMQIEFYLGEDWKFLAMATGIKSASCTHACIWCKCPAAARFDTSVQWSLDDPNDRGSYTIDEYMALSQLPKGKQKFNICNAPFFPTTHKGFPIICGLLCSPWIMFCILLACSRSNLLPPKEMEP